MSQRFALKPSSTRYAELRRKFEKNSAIFVLGLLNVAKSAANPRSN
jgi:hypothetical protein